MLKKKNRLRKRKEIKRVFREGKGFKEKFLVLKRVENNLRESRFCIIVPQDVSKKPTVRNRIKRRMREAIGQILKEIEKGYDVVLIALPEILGKDFFSINEATKKIFKKADLLK
jgi:ribonuclease P protein component